MNTENKKIIGQYPDETGHFGKYGGRYVGETLMAALTELEQAWGEAKNSPEFMKEFRGHALQTTLHGHLHSTHARTSL